MGVASEDWRASCASSVVIAANISLSVGSSIISAQRRAVVAAKLELLPLFMLSWLMQVELTLPALLFTVLPTLYAAADPDVRINCQATLDPWCVWSLSSNSVLSGNAPFWQRYLCLGDWVTPTVCFSSHFL